MPVGVVGPHRHEGEPGPGGGQELLVCVAAAVVRHLEGVGPQVDAAAPEPGLGRCPQVPGQQDREAARLRPDHQRQVVGICRGRRFRRIGGEHLEGHGTDRAPVTGEQRQPLRPRPVDEGGEGSGPVVGRREGARRHLAHVPARQRPGQSAHVVGVEVGDEDQRQGGDAEPVQAPVDGSDVGPGVDEDPGSVAGRERDRVALSHVADHRQGAGRWPAPHRLPQRPSDDQPDHRREREQS